MSGFAVMESLGLEGFRFANTEYAPLLWIVLAGVLFLLWRERRGEDELDSLIAPSLREPLVRRAGLGRRATQISMLGLACAALVLALMRPQWGTRQIAATRVGAELMIALDVSRSMLAEDVAPNRLERAKAEILDLLAYLEGDQVGLIAFAGRASVLSPLTPDFGFLRLALENAGPHSVTRGGTRLEEPIRRAVAGFGPPGPAQRAILLITDGEDHDSFARDAAEEAAEAGVSIIAIGFGDEAGSPIVVTDPRTGARQPILDADGMPVQSRLDGETLRELALLTDGAYIPAGTGVLDLESIHRAHLERLMRGATDRGGRIVRDEGYPWCVLVALLALAASVAISSRRVAESRTTNPKRQAKARTAAAALLLASAIALPHRPALAQTNAIEAPSPSSPATSASPMEESSPREIYNRAVQALDRGDAAEALRLFGDARRAGPADPVLRFQSTYNLGNASVAVAEATEAEDPRAALARLREAADWFRQAVQLREEDADARHNLEIALRKALVLEDMLAKQDQKDLDRELALIADAQRALAAGVGGLVQQLASTSDPALRARLAESLRSAFRDRATAEREIASDADRLADRTRTEHDALTATPEEERTPEDALRAAQLGGVLHYLHRAIERLGHTRRELRRQRPEAAYRRASAAIHELERARDQLREPDAAIDAIARELTSLRSRSAALASANAGIGANSLADPGDEPKQGEPGEAGEGADPGALLPSRPMIPAWLTAPSLAEEQRNLGARTQELDLRLRAGLEHSQRENLPPEAQAQLELLLEAEPFVAEAEREQRSASESLDAREARDAVVAQTRALSALSQAREFFLKLEGLIDLAYQDERLIENVLTNPPSPTALAESRSALLEAQRRNLARSGRIEKEIDRELAAAAQAREAGERGAAATPGAPDPEAIAERERQLTAASQLMTQVFAGMEQASDALDAERAPAFDDAQAGARRASRALRSLRWLFLTAAERVREIAREQTQLGDSTRDALVLGAETEAQAEAVDEAGTSAEARLAPLLPEQDKLSERTGELADEILEQSEAAAQAGTPPEPGPPPGGAAGSGPDAESLRKAAEHVLSAADSMSEAHDALSGAEPRGEQGLGAQQSAVESLLEALALLQPPQQDGDENQDGQQQQNEDEQSQGEGEDQQQQEEQQQPENADAARTLQRVLDREAERQRERAARARAQSRAVERDW